MSEIATDILFVMPTAVGCLIFLCTVAGWKFPRKSP